MKENTTYMKGRPRSTHFKAVQAAVKNYRIEPRTGKIYNRNGEEIGSDTYEPRVTIHLDGKKFGARVNKVIGFVVYGPEALRRGVSVRHKNGSKFDNRSSNLQLVYNPEAAKALRRRLREAQA